MATTSPQRKDESRPGQAASEVKNKAHDAASGVVEKAKDMGSSALETAKDAASTAASTVGSWASAAGEKADDAVSAAGGGIKSLGGTIREKGPHGGMLGGVTSTLADTLETSGRYLQKEGISGMAEDVTNLIRRNPLPSVLVGIAVGFLLARVTRS